MTFQFGTAENITRVRNIFYILLKQIIPSQNRLQLTTVPIQFGFKSTLNHKVIIFHRFFFPASGSNELLHVVFSFP